MKSNFFIVLLLTCSTLAAKQDVYVIGEEQGKEVVFSSSPISLQKSLEEAIKMQSSYALSALETNQDQSQWKLNKFTVGLGLEGEAGIGPWSLGLAIKQRLVFKKSSKGVQ